MILCIVWNENKYRVGLGKELRGVEKGKTKNKIYCMKYFKFKKKKKYNHHELTKEQEGVHTRVWKVEREWRNDIII